MSTRTPISFGQVMESVFGQRLSAFQQVFSETSSQYLFYGYRKLLISDFRGFLLVQASRKAGKVGFEVAISRSDKYPYHRLGDQPQLAVDGLRERLPRLLKGFDHAEEYRNPESLNKVLTQAAKEVDPALSKLMQRAVPRLNEAYKLWQPFYSEWVRLDRQATGTPPERYPGLPGEGVAFETLEAILSRGTFDRYMGPLKYRYRTPEFFHCHLYLLARGLEVLEPPPMPTPFQETSLTPNLAPPLDDPIASLTGRLPQDLAVDLAVSTSVRVTEFAFLHSLAAVEALFRMDEQGRPMESETVAGEIVDPPKSEVAPPTLLEAPEYREPKADLAPPPPLPKTPPPKRKPAPRNDDDDDPLAALEARLGLK